jgi:hypothetical protein
MRYGEHKTVLRDATRRNILVRVDTIRIVCRDGDMRAIRGCEYVELPSYTSTRRRNNGR